MDKRIKQFLYLNVWQSITLLVMILIAISFFIWQDKFEQKLAINYSDKGIKAYNVKDYPKAEKDFTRAIELDPHKPDYYGYKAATLNNMGKRAEMLKIIENGVYNNPSSELLRNQLNEIRKNTSVD